MIATGLIASGLLVYFPPVVRILVVALLFTLLPGWLIVRRWGGDSALHTGTRFALAFVVGLSLYAVVTWFCLLLGVSFFPYTVVLLVVSSLLCGLCFVLDRLDRRRSAAPPGSERHDAGDRARVFDRSALALAVLTCVFFVLAPPVPSYRGDEYDHMGYVRTILRSEMLVTDGVLAPAVGTPGPDTSDPRKGMWHPLLAALCAFTSLEPHDLWVRLPIVAAPAAVLAFAGFARAMTPTGGMALFALGLFTLFQGGLARHFLSAIGYGQNLALVYHWVLFVVALVYLHRPRGNLLGLILLGLAGGTLIHVDVAVHFGLALCGLVLFAKVLGVRRRPIMMLAATSLVCVAVVAAWKIATSYREGNVIHLHPQGLLYFFDLGAPHFVPSPIELLKKNGLLFVVGLALVPLLLLLRRYRRHALLNLALATPAILIAANPWLAPMIYERAGYLLHRFLLNVPTYTVTALVLSTSMMWARRGSWASKVLVMVFAFFWGKVFLTSAAAWVSDARAVRIGHALSEPTGQMGELVDFVSVSVPPGSVVLSDPVTSYTISAYCDVEVVTVLHQHGDPNDSLAVARLTSARAALSPFTSQIETMQTIHDFGVDYIVINGSFDRALQGFFTEWDSSWFPVVREKFESLDTVFRRIYNGEHSAVFRVVGDAPESYPWFPTVPFFDAPPGVIQHCRTNPSSAQFEIVGMIIDPAVAVPGEEIRISTVYRKNHDVESPMPLKLYLRMEDREYFAAARSFPFDKYLRRYRERRDAVFYRYRFDRVPFNGLYTPDMWPIGYNVYDTFVVRLPTDLHETTYELQVKLSDDSLIPNFALKDLLYNHDSYEGTACGQVEIREMVTR